jgi:peptidoglycan hydrolase CwlO-like protein
MNETILLLISNVLTAIAGWFVGKRKVTAETDNQVLKNLELAISVYSQIIDDLKKEIESLNIKVQELETKIDELHKENKLLKSKL